VSSYFTEQPEYFTLYIARRPGMVAVSPAPLPGHGGWSRLANGSIEELPCF
jgi:hypothetical protein